MWSYSNASKPQQVILSFSAGFPSQLGTSPNSPRAPNSESRTTYILRQMISIKCVWSILKCIDMSRIVYVVQVHLICLQSNAMQDEEGIQKEENKKKRREKKLTPYCRR